MRNHPEYEAWSTMIRWEAALEILSLDLAEPFLPEMGLRLSNVGPVRSLARQFIEKLDTLPNDTLEAWTAWLQEILAQIPEVAGQETKDRIVYWATEIVTLGNPKHHFGWPWVLRWLAGVRGRDAPAVKPNISENKLQDVSKIIRAQFEDELELQNKLEQAEALPRSDWDSKIYARGDESYNRLTLVSLAVTEHRFRRVWAEIEKILTSDEIDELVRWAKSQAAQLNLRPENLERPRLQTAGRS